MILKKFKRTNLSRTKRSMIGELVDYVLSEKEEAQCLMLKERYDVTQASFAVGYESQTQFSREYKKFFGESPQKDIARLRKASCFASTWQSL